MLARVRFHSLQGEVFGEEAAKTPVLRLGTAESLPIASALRVISNTWKIQRCKSLGVLDGVCVVNAIESKPRPVHVGPQPSASRLHRS
jgi:hypothetical protein